MTTRIGVIGAGVMGAGHALMLSSQIAGCQVTAIADADEARARSVAQKLGDAVFGNESGSAGHEYGVGHNRLAKRSDPSIPTLHGRTGPQKDYSVMN